MADLMNQEQTSVDKINRSTFNQSSSVDQSLLRSTEGVPERNPAGEITDVNCVEINGCTFDLGKSAEEDAEIMALKALAKRERGHCQWLKQGVCLCLICTVLLMNLIIGSSKMPSIVGLKDCGVAYWGIQAVFIIACFVITYFMVKLNQKEQALRRKYNVNYVEGEILFEGKVLTHLLLIGLIGGFVAGALGLGGGSIYNPALLALGANPKIASSTGMYLVMFSCINSCTVNFVSGLLDVRYGAFIGTWVVIGSLAGNFAADSYVKKSGK